MDLKGKRIVEIAQILFWAAMLVLYTRIGGMGMIYVAGSLELFFVVTYLFIGGIPETMEYMISLRRKKDMLKDASKVWKAALIYGIFATVVIEISILLINKLLISRIDLLYVDKLLELFMIAVPFLTCMQIIRGIIQVEFDSAMTGISKLVFVCCMVIGTVGSGMILSEYGMKVARLMQSVKLEHFYILLGLLPGMIFGSLGAIIFLVIMGLLHRRKITMFDEQAGASKDSILKLSLELFGSQLSEVLAPCMKRVPILVLLWLSLPEIAAENYLFGNFYGAMLPIFSIAWMLSDIGLIKYKRRFFIAYRKKAHEQFYRDLKAVLCYVSLHSAAICFFMLALHKSYLAIWDLQTSTSFMELAVASCIIGFLGLPCMVLEDVLKYRSMHGQAVFSVITGVIASLIAAAVCAKFTGVGIMMYVVCISVQLLFTVIFASWSVSGVVGINYLSVIIRSGVGIILTMLIALLLFGMQRLLFTAFGGLATLLICVATGLVLQYLMVLGLHIFDRDEYEYLPLSFVTRVLARFF